MRQKIRLLVGMIGILVLILDSRLALTAATSGMDVCIRAVIPSLFPFFFFSGLMTDGLKGVTLPFSRQISCLLKIPSHAAGLWLIGLLGGYPVGAQAVAQAVTNGSIHPKDGRRMLAFCNNCGPAFIFGIIGSTFEQFWMVAALWAIHIISSLVCAMAVPGEVNSNKEFPKEDSSMRDVLKRSIFVMAQVCGWIILFRVLLSFIEHWFGFLLSREPMVALSGLLELSNGCLALDSIEDIPTRFILCSGMVSFGGLCVTMQALSVCPKQLQTDLYLPGKCLQCGCSIVLSSGLMLCVYHNIYVELFLFGAAITAIGMIFLHIHEKRSRFLRGAII